MMKVPAAVFHAKALQPDNQTSAYLVPTLRGKFSLHISMNDHNGWDVKGYYQLYPLSALSVIRRV